MAVVTVVRAIGAVVSVVGIAVFAYLHLGRRPLHFLAYSFLWFALCAPALHSWYLLWGAVLLPMAHPSTKMLRAAIVVTVVLLGFAAMTFGLRNGPWMLVLILFGAVYWIMHTHELSQPMDEPEPVSA